MARIKRGVTAHKRKKKVLRMAKGYYGAKSKQFRSANQSVIKSMAYAYTGRKQKKRDYRRLWIVRINAAARLNDMTYSTFINGLKLAGIDIKRKMLSELAIADMDAFAELVKASKKAIEKGEKTPVKVASEKAPVKKEAAAKETAEVKKTAAAKTSTAAKSTTTAAKKTTAAKPAASTAAKKTTAAKSTSTAAKKTTAAKPTASTAAKKTTAAKSTSTAAKKTTTAKPAASTAAKKTTAPKAEKEEK